MNTLNCQEILALLMCSNTSLSQTNMQLGELSNTIFSKIQICLLKIKVSTIQKSSNIVSLFIEPSYLSPLQFRENQNDESKFEKKYDSDRA